MSYRVYIKNDYKPEIRWYPDQPWYQRKLTWVISLGLASIATVYYLTDFSYRINLNHDSQDRSDTLIYADEPADRLSTALIGVPELTADFEAGPETASETPLPDAWQSIKVKSGDNLSIIFDRLHLSPAVLYQVMASGETTAALKRLTPGDELQFLLYQDELQALRYDQNLTTSILITREDGGFRSETIVTELEHRTREASGVINDSLYMAALNAGLSDNLIMRFVSIYGWDIDFALDIRKGDRFKVIYEEIFKHNTKVGEGPILVTEFSNRGNIYRAVRYTSPEGETGFFNETGYSMRKAFLRTPLKFNRISSGFDLRRKHPVLNRIRAHKGVDYAAPTGTPVKATGDGIVVSIGKNGGYGNMIELRHGGIYNTVYAHLSKYVKSLKRGQHVKQGDIIGYVGMTGLATGPHLHYEFRVNGVHQNPLTVKLPKALRIPVRQLTHFHQQTSPLFAQLERGRQTDFAANEINNTDPLVLALDESNKSVLPVK